jgi:hypothetical protein
VIHKKGTWELPETAPPRHRLSLRFHEILAELGRLHDMKQSDYGRDNDPFANVRSSVEWGVVPWVGAMVRLNDKVKRLQKAATGGALANEGVLDSLNDIAVYAVIARCLYEESGSSGQGSVNGTPAPVGKSAPSGMAWDIPRV